MSFQLSTEAHLIVSDLIRSFKHVGVAYLLTVIIGWDREREAHFAGVRTFPIVGVASCGCILMLGEHPDISAQSRLLQGLITGIGFVGGGAILKDGSGVKGTATAASVLTAAVIGAAVAMDRIGVAITLAALNLLTLRALLPIKRFLDREPASKAADLRDSQEGK